MSKVQYTQIGGLLVHPVLEDVVKNEVCSGTEISVKKFWDSFETLVKEFGPKNESLLRKRDAIQSLIDSFHLQRVGKGWDAGEYTAFLSHIGYLVPEGADFKIDTENVDPEISSIAGPQLVVPVDKARFALNAANARWGSLLDAFYGTDAGPPEEQGLEKGGSYNPKRGAKVFEYAHKFLDQHFPLTNDVKYGGLVSFTTDGKALVMKTNDGKTVQLKNSSQFVGYNLTEKKEVKTVLLKNNDLHVEIDIKKDGNIGKTHPAGVNDVILESAITAIADFEDSVSAVDAHDKSVIYRNWAKLMKGTLEEKFEKNGKTVYRKLSEDRRYTEVGTGNELVLPGRVLLLVRNVSLHMYTNAVLTAYNQREVPEGLLDLIITAVSSLHDIGVNANRKKTFNSRKGSVYIVKPKQHGPEEVAFTVQTFSRIEQLLNIPNNTFKIGIMDEERRTTVNLKECIRAAKSRIIFINTGFLDRTGDEFHTSMRRGPFLPKDLVKQAVWLQAYEDWNVDIGIQCGFIGKAQIGKGMWAKPDSMKDMLLTKLNHPAAGANCAWVPSPTAATLHAIHYHEINVKEVQKKLQTVGRRAKLSDILTPPLIELFKDGKYKLSKEDISRELENNAQMILGYVVRWVIMGVGCSKVPDIHNVGLMEDRATLRINSQHIANWVLHGVVKVEEVIEAFKKMAKVVDEQNKDSLNEGYKNMSSDFNGNNGFLCALELVYNGLKVENGLTEHSLTKYRLAEKESSTSSKL